VLQFGRFLIEFELSLLLRCDFERLPVVIFGHALERMFQRTGTLRWADVRLGLEEVALFCSIAARPYLDGPYRQCAVPTASGLLVGDVERARLVLKTFLSAATMSGERARLRAELLALREADPKPFDLAAVAACAESEAAVAEILARPSNRWLRERYVPRVDPDEAAWSVGASEQAAGVRKPEPVPSEALEEIA
jgi:hypothetical protein